MEGQPTKRRRLYSLEPNKIVQSIFTRNYLNYLVPALMKIKEKSSADQDNSNCDTKMNVVKYEVDMAMVFSAQGFAWSDGLKVKLQNQKGHANAAKSTSSFLENFSSKSIDAKCKCKDMTEMKRDLAREEKNEEEDMNMQLKNLRGLIPGGEEMCNEQMVMELESYISCLQMQVNALQCLIAESS